MKQVIYNGAEFCGCGNGGCSQCPVAEFDSETQSVTLHDPFKPENGSFKMTLKEWNSLVTNARIST